VGITLACQWGLGRHHAAVPAARYESFLRSYYAAQMLLLASLVTAKMSAVELIIAIKPRPAILTACRSLIVLLALWAVGGVTALGLQCRPPRPWDIDAGVCVNLGGLYAALAAINIATDVALIAVPAVLVWSDLLLPKKRWEVIAVFGIRIV